MANDPSDPDAPAGGPNEARPRAEEPGQESSPARQPQNDHGGEQAGVDRQDAAGEATVQLPAPHIASEPAISAAWRDAAPGGGPSGPTGGPGQGDVAAQASGPYGGAPDEGRPGQQPWAHALYPSWQAGPGLGRPPELRSDAPGHPGGGNGGPWFPVPGAGYGAQQLPPAWYPDTRSNERVRPKRGALVGLGLVAMLLAGVIGGVVGNTLARANHDGSIGVLGQPLPDIDEASAPTTPVEAVAARVLPSVVQLRVEGPSSIGEGSAMVLSADGLLLTNNHVVEAAASSGTVTAVFEDGRTTPALIIGRDPSSDLAVIRAQNVSGLTPVELGNSDSVRVGQQVIAFGAPLGLGGTVTTGIISAVDRAVDVGPESGANVPTVLNALQTDAAINPGNSGGPLVDMEGRVVGINSAIATTGAQGGSIGVGFSIPVNQARRVAEELERTGHASRAVLGVTVGDNPRQAGAVIRDVAPGGAAEKAGMRPGDVVLRFGDQRINTGTDLQAAVGSRAPGEVVEVQLADRTVQATLTAAPN
jgi:putative serine protease PepD